MVMIALQKQIIEQLEQEKEEITEKYNDLLAELSEGKEEDV